MLPTWNLTGAPAAPTGQQAREGTVCRRHHLRPAVMRGCGNCAGLVLDRWDCDSPLPCSLSRHTLITAKSRGETGPVAPGLVLAGWSLGHQAR